MEEVKNSSKIETLNSNEYFNLLEDGGVQKKLIKEGNGNPPENEKLVIVDYTGPIESNKIVFNSSKETGTRRFILGKDKILKGLETSVRSMKPGEVSEFIVKGEYAFSDATTSNSERVLQFQLSMQDTQVFLAKEIEHALKLKDEGGALFSDKNYAEARKKFEEGFLIINRSPDKFSNEIKDIRFRFLLNISNCCLHIGLNHDCIMRIEEAMKIKENPKCYYLRAYAYANLCNFKKAEADLKVLETKMDSSDGMLVDLKNLISEKKRTGFTPNVK
jgi:hypothetical protein